MWAQRMGLRDTSSITKILNGAREPGELITERLVAYFDFNDKDKLYFEDMIRLKKISKDPRLSAVLMEKMGVEALESQSFTVQADKLAEAKNLIAEFRNKFAEVFNHEQAEAYYQIQIQVLPMQQGRDLSVGEDLTVS
ncbi:hypothetical protein D3C72_1408020 [compost metagenome]